MYSSFYPSFSQARPIISWRAEHNSCMISLRCSSVGNLLFTPILTLHRPGASPSSVFLSQAVAQPHPALLLTELWPGPECLYLWNKHSLSLDWNCISCSDTALHFNEVYNTSQELLEIELMIIRLISHVRAILPTSGFLILVTGQTFFRLLVYFSALAEENCPLGAPN